MQYSPIRLELVRLIHVSSLFYGTWAMLALNFPVQFEKKLTDDSFHGNGSYVEIPTKKEPIRTLGFTSRLPGHIIT